MTNMTSARQVEEKCPGKLPTVLSSDPGRRAAAIPEISKRVFFMALFCLSLFAGVARAQVMGITKPFDPANFQSGSNSFQLGPIGEAVVTGNGIEYHGGPVMQGPHNVYLIWYGNFSGNSALSILPDLINGFGGSQYFNTNTTYGDTTGNIANTVTLAGEIFDNYSQGTALNDTKLPNVLLVPFNNGKLPVDPNGIYFILTSPDVTETSGTTDGFCKTFCGFHTFATLNNGVTSTDIKVAFVGDPATQCPARPGQAGCSAQALSPNGNEGADAMSSVIAHELNETVTDPEINAWFHIDGSGEVGDLCNTSSAATTFGPTFTSLNGAHANVVLSGRQFLLQSNWLNSGGGFCAMGFNAQTPSGLTFVPVPPCRVADTRNSAGAFGGPFLVGNATREFDIPNSACNIPSTAQAYSVNATVVPHGFLGFLTAFPCGQPLPLASTLNATDGRVKAAAAIVPAGTSGGLCFFSTNDTDLALDINGYFVPNSSPTALAFFPVTPCRVVDTRLAAGALGGPSIAGNAARTFPDSFRAMQSAGNGASVFHELHCGPPGPTGFLTTWPAEQQQPLVSTLNANLGGVTANSAIVPAGANGDISVFVSNPSDVVIDVNGYFAAPAAGGLSLFALTPCRVLDTRTSPVHPPTATPFDVSVALSGCGAPTTAQSFVLNATVVPPAPFGFLTLWPAGTTQPLVSTLNAIDGAITSNMAIVPTANGAISAFGSHPVQLILDISGYFAP